MKKLSKALSKLPSKIEKPITGVTLKELNTVTITKERWEAYFTHINPKATKAEKAALRKKVKFERDLDGYDPSASFRFLLLVDGFTIKKLIACYYQGWECDQWGALVTKDGNRYKAVSSHGGITYESY